MIALIRTEFSKAAIRMRTLIVAGLLVGLPTLIVVAINGVFGTIVAWICTLSPVRGLTPMRAARAAGANLPKPVKLTESPLFSVSVTLSRKESTALPASRAERPLFWATFWMKSCLVNESSCESGTWDQTLA